MAKSTLELHLLLPLAVICSHYCNAAVQSFSAPTGPLCIGTTVTINCTVVDLGEPFLRGTYWSLQKAGNVSVDYCYLDHGIPLPQSDDTRCLPYTAESEERSGDSFPSVLSAQVSSQINNTIVQCSGPIITNIIGNTTLQVSGTRQPSTLGFHLKQDSIFEQLPGSGMYNATLQWAVPDPNAIIESHVLQYIVTVTPEAPPCGHKCTFTTTAREFSEGKLSLLLSIDQHYHIILAAENLDSSENACQKLDVQLQVPGPIEHCVSVPYYDQDTNLLIAIENTWIHTMSMPEEIAPGISASASQYTLIFTNSTNHSWMEAVAASEACFHEACKYITAFNGSANSNQYYSVQIMPTNVIANGPPANCTVYPLAMQNDDVRVRPTVGTRHVFIDISSTVNFIGNISVSYGTESSYSYLSYVVNTTTSITSQQEDRNHHMIPLSQDLAPNTTYYYKATVESVITTIAVIGSFKIDCSHTDLGLPLEDSNDYRCRYSEGAAMVEGGVVCYDGRTAGSKAWYSCNTGYTLTGSATPAPRVCLDSSGTWSGNAPTCKSIPPTASLTSSEIGGIAVALAVLGFIIGATLASAVFCLVWVRRVNQHRECLTVRAVNRAFPSLAGTASSAEETCGPQYESINELFTKEAIPVRDNTAYDLAQ